MPNSSLTYLTMVLESMTFYGLIEIKFKRGSHGFHSYHGELQRLDGSRQLRGDFTIVGIHP